MKVYVITSGCYSDYCIEAISLDKDEAEKICATLNNNRWCDGPCKIEEHDTENIKIDNSSEVKTRFVMVVGYRNSEIKTFYEPYHVTEDVNKISVIECKTCGNEDRIRITATLPKGTLEEKAKKIMFDRIAKFKAERAGI